MLLKKVDKPLNVVWISCEDMGPILGAYGNTIIKTPNLDRLAREGSFIKTLIQLLVFARQAGSL
ncbi:MAG: hypothetical protein CM15mP121_1910 [Bacteroidota bacterium]|nr:MAG: hypothetical protein CM15mP121_1910 [Bacteroidota bacterium]